MSSEREKEKTIQKTAYCDRSCLGRYFYTHVISYGLDVFYVL